MIIKAYSDDLAQDLQEFPKLINEKWGINLKNGKQTSSQMSLKWPGVRLAKSSDLT